MAGTPAPGAVRPGAVGPAVKPPAAPAASPPTAAALAAAPVAPPPKKLSFLGVLRPKTVADAKPANQLMLVGNKGVKSIAAVAVGIPDGVSANGRTRIHETPGLPRPDGSKVVVITFDNQTAQSLLNHYGTLIDGHGIEVYHIMEPVFDDNGVTVYPGWDGSSAESGVIVAAAFKELLLSLRESRNVGLLVIDHYGKFIEEAGRFYAHAKAKMPLDGKLDPGQWGSRATLLNDIDFLVRTAPMEGGWVVVTGSRDRNEGEKVTTFSKDRKEFAMKEVVPAKWSEKILHNWGTIIQLYKMETKGGYAWRAEVEEGRHPLFPLGAQVDLSGRHIGAFQIRDLVTFPEDAAEPTPKVVAAKTSSPSPQTTAAR